MMQYFNGTAISFQTLESPARKIQHFPAQVAPDENGIPADTRMMSQPPSFQADSLFLSTPQNLLPPSPPPLHTRDSRHHNLIHQQPTHLQLQFQRPRLPQRRCRFRCRCQSLKPHPQPFFPFPFLACSTLSAWLSVAHSTPLTTSDMVPAPLEPRTLTA